MITTTAATRTVMSASLSAATSQASDSDGTVTAPSQESTDVTDTVTASGTRRQRRSPRTRDKENHEYFGMMRRMVRAAARRVKAEDPSDLAELLAIRAELDKAIGDTARALNANNFSWSEIGYGAGISKRAAYARWGQADGE